LRLALTIIFHKAEWGLEWKPIVTWREFRHHDDDYQLAIPGTTSMADGATPKEI